MRREKRVRRKNVLVGVRKCFAKRGDEGDLCACGINFFFGPWTLLQWWRWARLEGTEVPAKKTVLFLSCLP